VPHGSFLRRGLLFDLLTHKTGDRQISWQNEIWPFQWRIAISWISGYFVYQTFNPFLFAFKGPVAAGKMGMSLSFANAVMVIAMAWCRQKMHRSERLSRKNNTAAGCIVFQSSAALCSCGRAGNHPLSGQLPPTSFHPRPLRGETAESSTIALLLIAALLTTFLRRWPFI